MGSVWRGRRMPKESGDGSAIDAVSPVSPGRCYPCIGTCAHAKQVTLQLIGWLESPLASATFAGCSTRLGGLATTFVLTYSIPTTRPRSI
jgi:hypothetical protein